MRPRASAQDTKGTFALAIPAIASVTFIMPLILAGSSLSLRNEVLIHHITALAAKIFRENASSSLVREPSRLCCHSQSTERRPDGSADRYSKSFQPCSSPLSSLGIPRCQKPPASLFVAPLQDRRQGDLPVSMASSRLKGCKNKPCPLARAI